MPFNRAILQTTNPYKREDTYIRDTRTIFYGEVISIDDDSDGGRIKVKITGMDNQFTNDNLPWCYPLLPKFFHLYPQVGEVVRVFIEDARYPQRSRFWLGSVISQLQKVGFDSFYGAFSTTNLSITSPEPAISTYPDANGVFPLKTDVAIIGKVNTDVILRINEVHIRAGKHENDNILKLNTLNPAEISLVYEQSTTTTPTTTTGTTFQSSTIIMGDKIALISHTGNPKFKAARLESKDRERIFNEGHPIARGDTLVQALEIIRNALINHIHGYTNLAADKTAAITDLEKINLDAILQKNIVVN